MIYELFVISMSLVDFCRWVKELKAEGKYLQTQVASMVISLPKPLNIFVKISVADSFELPFELPASK